MATRFFARIQVRALAEDEPRKIWPKIQILFSTEIGKEATGVLEYNARTPNLMFPVSGRELAPGGRDSMIPDPVAVAS